MWIFGFNGKSGYSARSTAEQVTKGVDGTGLVAIVTARSTAEQVTKGVDGTGLVAIVTGSTNGIGLETARVLALHGVHVIMAVRNVKAGAKVKELLNKIPSAKIDVMELDLNSQASIRKFAKEYISSGLPLNILINNAGIMAPPFTLSKDNIEQQFAVNHLGPFLLTNLLLDTMKNTAQECGKEGRVVSVASELHRYTAYKEGIIFDRINDKSSYNGNAAYGQSKLANILHCNELARRLQEEGANVTANSLHPGVIATNIVQNSAFVGCIFGAGQLLLKNVRQGAATTCYLALNPKVSGTSGAYFTDSNIAKASKMGRDPEMAKKLWEFSLNLTQESK